MQIFRPYCLLLPLLSLGACRAGEANGSGVSEMSVVRHCR